MIVSGVLSQDEAIRGIDFNTIALLTGMMVLVAIARRCGMFEYLAVWVGQKKGRAQPLGDAGDAVAGDRGSCRPFSTMSRPCC